MVGLLTDALAWLVVAAFAAGAGLHWLARREETAGHSLGATVDGRTYRQYARTVTTGAWILFAVFWLALFPHFAFEQKSYVEGILSLLAVPACAYAGYLLWEGRSSLFVLSRAVAVMGVVYLPFETIPAISLLGTTVPAPRQVLIEIVAGQTGFLMDLLGVTPELVRGEQGYMNTYQTVITQTDAGFIPPEAYPSDHDGRSLLQFSVVLACTGIGSMAIFVGLIGAVQAPLRRKARALAVSIPIIYGLNLVRTTFIGISFLDQRLHVAPETVLFLFGSSYPYKVSYFLSDRVISQVLAVVALVGVTYLVVRELPEILTVIEDVLFMATKDEYDLSEALNVPNYGDEEPRPQR